MDVFIILDDAYETSSYENHVNHVGKTMPIFTTHDWEG